MHQGVLANDQARYRIVHSMLHDLAGLPGSAGYLGAVVGSLNPKALRGAAGSATGDSPELQCLYADENVLVDTLVAYAIRDTLAAMSTAKKPLLLKYQKSLLRRNALWLLCATELFTDAGQRLTAEFKRPGITSRAQAMADLGLSVEARYALSRAFDLEDIAADGLPLPDLSVLGSPD